MGDVPNRTLSEFLNGSIDFSNDTLRIALYSSAVAYTFDPDTHEFVSDVLDGGTTAQELQGSSGYTGSTDRQTLLNPTVTTDNTNDLGSFDADNVTWQNLDSVEDIQGILVYKQVGGDDSTPGDDPIIFVIDDANTSELPFPTNGSNVTINWDTLGVLTIE